MISIDKGEPSVRFKNRGLVLKKKLEDEYDANDIACNSGRPLDIKGYYANARTLLVTRQFNKCCFSEAKFNGDYKHVEHFRPKGRVDDYDTNSQEYPGYYWLAYDWANLYLCKGVINGSYKRNYFPLMKGSPRNRNHKDLNVEKPILIDPSTENPRKHIRFRNDEPYGKTKRGTINIELLGLRDPDFVDARRDHLTNLNAIREGVEALLSAGIPISNITVQKNIQLLKDSVKKDAEFSSMAIDFLSGWIHLK